MHPFQTYWSIWTWSPGIDASFPYLLECMDMKPRYWCILSILTGVYGHEAPVVMHPFHTYWSVWTWSPSSDASFPYLLECMDMKPQQWCILSILTGVYGHEAPVVMHPFHTYWSVWTWSPSSDASFPYLLECMTWSPSSDASFPYLLECMTWSPSSDASFPYLLECMDMKPQ